MNDKRSIAEQFEAYHKQLVKILQYSCKVPNTPLDRLSGLSFGIAASLRDREDAKVGAGIALIPEILKTLATPLDVMKMLSPQHDSSVSLSNKPLSVMEQIIDKPLDGGKILDSSFTQNEIQRASVDYYLVGHRLYRLFDPGMAGGQFEYLSKDRKRWLKSEHGQYRYKFLAAKADRARKITAEQAERFKAGEGQAVAPYPHLYTSGDRLYWVSAKGAAPKLFVPSADEHLTISNYGTWIIARTTEAKLLKRHGRGKVIHWPSHNLKDLQQVRRMQWSDKRVARAEKAKRNQEADKRNELARAEEARLNALRKAKTEARARLGLPPVRWMERILAPTQTDREGNRYFILTKPASRGATPPPRPYRIVVGQTNPEFLSMNSWFRSIQFKTRAALLNAPSLRPASVQEIAFLSQKS